MSTSYTLASVGGKNLPYLWPGILCRLRRIRLNFKVKLCAHEARQTFA
ncbi:MAG: hypothetical protein ACK5RO_08215 [Pseudobdellovibrionaceae bacterium]